jgi:Zinc knuckle
MRPRTRNAASVAADSSQPPREVDDETSTSEADPSEQTIPANTQEDRTRIEEGPSMSEQLLKEQIKVLKLQLRLQKAGIPEEGDLGLAASSTAHRSLHASERFKGHEVKYSGKAAAEYYAWVKALEHDHRYYSLALQREADKVHYAQRTLTADSKAAKHWRSFQDHTDEESLTWDRMKAEMLAVLGSQSVRMQENFSKWLRAKWQHEPVVLQMYLESLEAQMEDPLPESVKLRHLWDRIPAELALRVRPLPEAKTRAELVNQLATILQDDKRMESLQSRNEKGSSQKSDSKDKGKGKDKKGHKRGRSEKKGEGKNNDSDSQSRANSKKSKTFDPLKATCFNCGEKGHTATSCSNPTRPAGQKAKERWEARRANQDANTTPIGVNQVQARKTQDEASGKDQAS